MRKHNGMRPQDIVILIKIYSDGSNIWKVKDLAHELHISQSEISESIHRSYTAGFLSWDKKEVFRERLFEFLIHGIKYVFPVQLPGPVARGMPTAGSAPPIKKNYNAKKIYVWKDPEGRQIGQSIQPLHPSVPALCKIDYKLYELFALVDAMRVGVLRGKGLVEVQLKKRMI